MIANFWFCQIQWKNPINISFSQNMKPFNIRYVKEPAFRRTSDSYIGIWGLYLKITVLLFFFPLVLSQTVEHFVSGNRPWPSDPQGEMWLMGTHRREQTASWKSHQGMLCDQWPLEVWPWRRGVNSRKVGVEMVRKLCSWSRKAAMVFTLRQNMGRLEAASLAGEATPVKARCTIAQLRRCSCEGGMGDERLETQGPSRGKGWGPGICYPSFCTTSF